MDPNFKSSDNRFQIYHGDCFDVMRTIEKKSINVVCVDPPYFLSNGGMTCKSGKMVSVNKGGWDSKTDPIDIHKFNIKWLSECKELLTDNGTIWVSGTRHNIYSVGFAMQQLGFKLLNDIVFQKPNPPPNLSCRYFTHSTETILWAAKTHKSKYTFNYKDMKKENGGKQMKSVWTISPPLKSEKLSGKHSTQKPLKLLDRIIMASTNKDDLILDIFNGSGTTGISAIGLGRRYIGIEKEKGYFDLTVKRFKDKFGGNKNG